MDSFAQMTNVMVYATNVYQFCAIDYYMIAVAKSVSSVSGASSQLINLFYRFFNEADEANYYKLSVALGDDDYENAGQAFGVFVGDLLAVEIPESTETPSYSAAGGIA